MTASQVTMCAGDQSDGQVRPVPGSSTHLLHEHLLPADHAVLLRRAQVDRVDHVLPHVYRLGLGLEVLAADGDELARLDGADDGEVDQQVGDLLGQDLNLIGLFGGGVRGGG